MDWIYATNDPLVETLISSIMVFILVIIFTRIVGLRSFAKFTTFDFAFTVAVGSIVASVLSSSTSVAHGAVGIASLLLLPYIFSILQRRSESLNNLISNQPLLLMKGSEILHDNLRKGRIHEDQLIAKLREANVLHFDQVIAVVLETTGDISVLHKSAGANDELQDKLLQGVRKE